MRERKEMERDRGEERERGRERSDKTDSGELKLIRFFDDSWTPRI